MTAHAYPFLRSPSSVTVMGLSLSVPPSRPSSDNIVNRSSSACVGCSPAPSPAETIKEVVVLYACLCVRGCLVMWDVPALMMGLVAISAAAAAEPFVG